MKKRDRLVLTKTPDNSFQIDTDDTIFLETPKALKKKSRNTVQISPRLVVLFMKKYCIYILFTVLVLFQIPFKNAPNSGEIKELKSEVHLLKLENLGLQEKIDFINIGPSNIASLDQGCTVNYRQSSIPYTYGFLRRKYTDPHVILSGDSECYSFEGNKGKVVLQFKEKRKIVGVGIFHRKTENLASSPKDVTVYVDDKEVTDFSFNPDEIFHKVTFKKEAGKTIRFKVKNNHGEKGFTCIYRIFVYGW